MIGTALKDRRILVVEDEYLLADELSLALAAAQAVVIGPVAALSQALDVIADTQNIHGAVLDVNLRGEMVFPAADRLQDRMIPIIFVTGYDSSVIPPRFGDTPRCEKPLGVRHVLRILERTLQQS